MSGGIRTNAAGSYAGGNHRSVKQGNRAAIFRAIHALGPIARVDLARRTGLTPGTVSNIVDELIRDGLAREKGVQESVRVGRRAVNLEVVPSSRFAIGVDIARSAVTAAVVDLAGQPLAQLSENLPSPEDEVSFPVARRLAEQLLADLPARERAKIVGIGVGAVGPVDVRGRRHLAPRGQGSWQELDPLPELQRRGTPIFVDNNSNTSALAELWFGAGQGLADFILLTLGTGIGSGLVLGGDLYRGDHGLTGEVGHMSVNANGARCPCGNYGCLELFASVPAILSTVRQALAEGAATSLRGADLTAETLIAAFRAGDDLATRAFDDVVRHLATGIVNLIYAVDPAVILIGRELSAAGDVLLDRLRSEVRHRIFSATRDIVDIRPAALVDAPVIGAATLALREFFLAPVTEPASTSRVGAT